MSNSEQNVPGRVPAGIQSSTAAKPLHIAGAGTMAIYLLLVSLSVLFAASIVGYLIIRFRFDVHVHIPLPATLWLSTALIVISSVTIQVALSAIRRNHETGLRIGLLATLGLGMAFLVVQIFNWLALAHGFHVAATQLAVQQSNAHGKFAPHHSVVDLRHMLYAAFYAFTFLHAAHVIGGLVPLAFVAYHAYYGQYSANYHPGVRHVTLYWHFLTVVWLVLFALMFLTL